MKNGLESRHWGNSSRGCGCSVGLGSFEGTGEEIPAPSTVRKLAQQFRREIPEILYWASSLGFGGYALGRIVGVI